MINSNRNYGESPYHIALIHGGPGAVGELAPFAKELSKSISLIELLQTKSSIDELIQELFYQVNNLFEIPVILIGHSWGAWLSLLFAAKNQELVKKIIIVGCAPFNKEDANEIISTRISRLTKEDKEKLDSLLIALQYRNEPNKNLYFKQIGDLLFKSDSYKPINYTNSSINYNYEIFQKVWLEADVIRNSGLLLKKISKIKCPVVAFHGNYDPHPGNAVKNTLSQTLDDFTYHELDKCGHDPWNEVHANKEFYSILLKEINN